MLDGKRGPGKGAARQKPGRRGFGCDSRRNCRRVDVGGRTKRRSGEGDDPSALPAGGHFGGLSAPGLGEEGRGFKFPLQGSTPRGSRRSKLGGFAIRAGADIFGRVVDRRGHARPRCFSGNPENPWCPGAAHWRGSPARQDQCAQPPRGGREPGSPRACGQFEAGGEMFQPIKPNSRNLPVSLERKENRIPARDPLIRRFPRKPAVIPNWPSRSALGLAIRRREPASRAGRNPSD